MLRCGDGTLYTGSAKDLERRLGQHRAGRASRYTRSHLPVALVGSQHVESWSRALAAARRIEELGPSYRTALILNPCMTATQLLRAILVELGLQPQRADRVTCLDMLNHFLLEQAAAGNDVVLIIDEAQDLEDDLLEQVRLLSNLETDQRKLLQIVLIGQPELRDPLDQSR